MAEDDRAELTPRARRWLRVYVVALASVLLVVLAVIVVHLIESSEVPKATPLDASAPAPHR